MIKLSQNFLFNCLLVCGGIAALAMPAVAATADQACGQSPVSPETLKFPKLCDIPASPDKGLGAAGYRALVIDTRQSGAALAEATSPQGFSLSNTEAFAAEARAEATPPAPLTTPSVQDTEFFASEARQRAMPSPRPR